MDDGLSLTVNGKPRTVASLHSPAALHAVLEALALRADRIAVELNGELAPRTGWAQQQVRTGDRLEIVHFVGGGCGCERLGSCGYRAKSRSLRCATG